MDNQNTQNENHPASYGGAKYRLSYEKQEIRPETFKLRWVVIFAVIFLIAGLLIYFFFRDSVDSIDDGRDENVTVGILSYEKMTYNE